MIEYFILIWYNLVNIGKSLVHLCDCNLMLVVKSNFALPIKSEKRKHSGSVVPGSFKNFQNTFERSLGFIHI